MTPFAKSCFKWNIERWAGSDFYRIPRETGEYLLFSPAKYSAQRGNDVFQQKRIAQWTEQFHPRCQKYHQAQFWPVAWWCPGEDFRILITTDVLAEGMNLHRAGRIINYDLPWNPTRVMQRLGRINRVGTAHKKLYIFNFFPTAQADSHLGLQDNITKKSRPSILSWAMTIKSFFEEENPDPHGLFRNLVSIGEEEDEDWSLSICGKSVKSGIIIPLFWKKSNGFH